jgi:hypothetical protein
VEAHFGDDSESESYESDDDSSSDDVADTQLSQAHDARQSSSSVSQGTVSARLPRGDSSTIEKVRAYAARA